MIKVRDAVDIASRFLKDMYPAHQCQDPRLEEVILTEDEQSWLITLSFLRKQSSDELASALGALTRDYKQIMVNVRDGTVRSMVIRSTHDV